MARKPTTAHSPNTRTTVPVHRLKARLSYWLAKVRAGATVVVTDRGRPVARIDPVSPADDPESLLAVLVARGLARPPAAPLKEEFFTGPRVADPAGRVLAALLAGRGDASR